MSQGIPTAAARCSLQAVLAERGALPAKVGLAIFRQVLRQVRALHAGGATHRAVGPDTVLLDATGRATLVAAPLRELDVADVDCCPPELAGAGIARLPAGIEAARQELARAGVDLDPRRIDVYQLGALLCRMLTGQPVSAYLCSPKAKAQVPPPLRPLIERALGHNPAGRLGDCDALAAALEAAGREPAAVAPETPPAGSAIAAPSRNPQGGAGSPTGPSPSPSGDLPFKRLGHYRVDRRIGRGGMGDVYLGYEEVLQRPVAIKVLPAELTRGEEFVRRFRAEATAVAKLTHPNIVPIYSIGQDAGCHFFVMQYVEGESLDRLLARKGRLGVDKALAILDQCLAGLGAAHRAGLVHRDVKPGNVLLEADGGRALVADFGLVKVARAEGAATATGVVMGTVDYITPEQARGREVDGRADLYSVGVMAYQMLSGRLPFKADTPSAMLFQHAYEPPPPLGAAAPETPGPLAAVVDRLLAKDPAARYQTCEDVLADFRRCRAGQPLLTSAETSAAGRPSQIIPAPDLEPIPEPPCRLGPAGRWQRLRERLLDWLQARAPELVQKLQNTEQQVDGAVAEYQRRRDRLAGLVAEAEEAGTALADQADSHRAAAAAAASPREKEECERVAAELDAQAAEQQGHLARMRAQLAQVEATLGRLASQGELLRARLRVAAARQRMEEGPARPRRLRRLAVAAALGLVLLAGLAAIGLYIARSWSRQPVKPDAQGQPDMTATEDMSKEEIANSLGMTLKLIKPGTFLMGSPKDEEGRFDNEGPQHEVKITKPFYMGACPVTRGQFAAFVKDAGYQTEAEKDGKGGFGVDPATKQWEQKPEYTWRHPGFSQGDDHPVVQVFWSDATAFCAWLSKKEGKTYELPTEAEWEYACRAGTTTRFWCGSTDANLQSKVNIADASLKEKFPGATWAVTWDDGYAFTSPVGTFKPNPWGLYDMHANVWQWCADWYGLYQKGSIKDPKGEDIGNSRVLRGGSWYDEPRYCRSAIRYDSIPADRCDNRGFRVVLRPAGPSNPDGGVRPATAVTKEEPKGDLANSLGMKMKLLPAGKFFMGSREGESGNSTDVRGHEVVIPKPFYMAVYPTTRGQFEAFVDAEHYLPEAEASGAGAFALDQATHKWERKPQFNWKSPGFEQTDDHPVVDVTRLDAQRFCEWLGQKEGKVYQLPTEAEWEYACRAGTTSRYWCGDADASLQGNANIADASLKAKHPGVAPFFVLWDDGFPYTSPVGSFRPNPWGLYDMLGNVRQLVADRFNRYETTGQGANYPDNMYATRGSCWLDVSAASYSGNRIPFPDDHAGSGVGFRVILRTAGGGDPEGAYRTEAPAPEKKPVERPVAPLSAEEKAKGDLTNAIGMKLKMIQPGKFLIGSPKDEKGRLLETEGPQHEVEITRQFYLGDRPVTVGQFRAFVNDIDYRSEAEIDSRFQVGGYDKVRGKWDIKLKCTWRDPGFPQGEDHPVVNVTWHDAVRFCQWLSKKEGKVYELPTEAEWEYACRAGTKTRFWCGDDEESLKGNGNLADASMKDNFKGPFMPVRWDDGYAFTSPTGAFRPNPWGLYDMAGNVQQWCADYYGPYSEGFVQDPKGAEKGDARVLRGGSFIDGSVNCRSARRAQAPPMTCSYLIGFRVVLRPKPE